ncbi:hypothetical protein [Dethiothermospora halolimnae]|uniref:hypothetical protein n=1 Tax=Dethiothermospora halolimnae TaxID=3114390 RepID=UPI003CCBE16D
MKKLSFMIIMTILFITGCSYGVKDEKTKEVDPERISSRDNSKIDDINSQFNDTFKTKDIREYLLKDIKKLKSPYGKEDYKYKEYIWTVNNKSYKLLVGEFHLDNFAFLYNNLGKFLDGYMWENKNRAKINVAFRKNQNHVQISPIKMASGTGIHHIGGVWFNVYNEKLLKSFEYPIRGYDAPPYTISYSREYKLIDEGYNKSTGDYQSTYKLGINTYALDELLGLEKTIKYKWNMDKGQFDFSNYSIFDKLDNLLFSEGIEDEILNKNYEKFKLIIDKDYYDNKEDDMGQVAMFLTNCDKSEKRDKLLEKIYEWFLNNKKLWNSEGIMEILEKEIIVN